MTIAIHWFRQDLRLSDNPALFNAIKHRNVLPIYILDDINAGQYCIGHASRWWLYHSLKKLNLSLDGRLMVYKGDPIDIFNDIMNRFDITEVFWNRCYEPWIIDRDTKIKTFLTEKNIRVTSSNGSLLWEPWEIKKEDGAPYKVFTPFYKKGCLNAKPPREPLPKPVGGNYQYDESALSIDNLNLLENILWEKSPEWSIGEEAALQRFDVFSEEGLPYYKEGRNFPAKPYVSKLSPHLHFGEISPNQLWYAVQNLADNQHTDCFRSELGWREFSYNLLYYNPGLPHENLQPKFDEFPWIENTDLLSAWQMGQTGIPMVDAGMRELLQTGYMHNRTRMIVGSFLVKNLRLHWHNGERWFWDRLLDADLANNSASWQWVAGTGADAAPYFRIFNPVFQGQKFDPDGHYIRQYVPEIKNLPNKYLHSPWEAPKDILESSGVKLGETYPIPIVDLKKSRVGALKAFELLKKE